MLKVKNKFALSHNLYQWNYCCW